MRRFVVLVAFCFASSGSVASADTDAERRADRLFTEAKDLAIAGKYAEACPKLEESQRLDPALGTEFNLADCYEHVGRTATAWRLFVDVERAAKAAGKKEREDSAHSRAATLEPGLARLRIVGVTAATVSGLVVVRDGETLRADQLDATAVDPGEHVIEVSAPGKKPWRTTVRAVAGALADVQVPALEPLVVAPPPSSSSTATIVVPPPEGRASTGLGTQRVVAIAVGALGVVGIGLGAGFGIVSLSKHGDASSLCPQANPCHDRAGAAAWSDATSAGTISTIAFAAGGIALAGAATLWLLAPKATKSGVALSPTFAPGVFGLSARGAF